MSDLRGAFFVEMEKRVARAKRISRVFRVSFVRAVRGRKGTCRCETTSLYFSSCVIVGYYEKAIKRAVVRLKGKAHDDIADFLSERLYERVKEDPRYAQIDMVLFVPKFITDYLKNGINASSMLARRFSDKMKAPMESHILVKVKKTRKQVGLSYSNRVDNIKGAFFHPSPGQDKKGKGFC